MKYNLLNRLNFKINKLSKNKFTKKEKNLIIIARKEQKIQIKNNFWSPAAKLIEKKKKII